MTQSLATRHAIYYHGNARSEPPLFTQSFPDARITLIQVFDHLLDGLAPHRHVLFSAGQIAEQSRYPNDRHVMILSLLAMAIQSYFVTWLCVESLAHSASKMRGGDIGRTFILTPIAR